MQAQIIKLSGFSLLVFAQWVCADTQTQAHYLLRLRPRTAETESAWIGTARLDSTFDRKAKVWRTRERVELLVYSQGRSRTMRWQTRYVERDDGVPVSFDSTLMDGQTRVRGELRDGDMVLHSRAKTVRMQSVPLEQIGAFPMAAAKFPQRIRFDPHRLGRSDLTSAPIARENTGTWSRRYFGQEIEFVPRLEWHEPVQLQAFSPIGMRALSSRYGMGETALRAVIRYRLRDLGGSKLVLPSTGEQRVIPPLSGSRPRHISVIEVCGNCGDLPAPTEQQQQHWLRANALIKSDDLLLRQFARAKAGSRLKQLPRPENAAGVEYKMRRLSRALALHMTAPVSYLEHNNASKAFRQRSGDCLEFALLLTSFARAQGIPARAIMGYAYTPHFEGRSHVYAPHAWTVVWTGQRWRSFDAALGQLSGRRERIAATTSGHIAVAYLDDPSVVAAIKQQLDGALVIDAAGQLPSE